MNTILGQKIQQTQRFLENGNRIPVTIVSVAPNAVLQVKTIEKDGYNAIQIGTGMRKKATKSQHGIAKKANLSAAPRFIKEVRFFDDATLPQAGDSVALADVFKAGDIIDVTGTSKGKGWAGVVKRHNFRGGPRTHGQSDRERAPGSLGQTTTPGRVYKGKRMAGRMGNETVTLQHLFVADVIGNDLYIAGLIPGSLKSYVSITKSGEMKEKKFSAMRRADGLDASEPVAAPATAEEATSPVEVEETSVVAAEKVETKEEAKSE